MIEFAADLPDWLWAMVALYFGLSAIQHGLSAYISWLEFKSRTTTE